MDALLDEQDAVFAWRRDRLERAGYPASEAEMLAIDPSVDLHVAVDLLARGCSLEQAMKILG
jgi:hypothetical protein